MRTHNFKRDIDYWLFYGLVIVMVLVSGIFAENTLGVGGSPCSPCDTAVYDWNGHFIKCVGCITDCGVCYDCNMLTTPPSCHETYDQSAQDCCPDSSTGKCKSICDWKNACMHCDSNGSGNCKSLCDPIKCETCYVGGICVVCNGDPYKACCNGECYDTTTKGCCGDTIYDLATEKCCDDTSPSYICDINCKSCCNGSCCNSTNCEICKNNTCVVAHPTNMQQISVTDIGYGILEFEYTWESTTGDLVDLDNTFVGEEVTYPGGGYWYYLPSPPFAGRVRNPTTSYSPYPGTIGHATDDQFTPPIPGPYQNSSFTATQVYKYYCSPCLLDGETLLDIGPITRYVSGDGNLWRYSITKSGAYAEIFPLP